MLDLQVKLIRCFFLRILGFPWLLVLACDAHPDAIPRRSDPTLRTLDRILARDPATTSTSDRTSDSVASCLSRVEALELCPSRPGGARTLPIRVVLDERYVRQWSKWTERLQLTLSCVNQLYLPTGLQWKIAAVLPWDPGAQRHDLLALLDRLRLNISSDLKSVVVGITVWEERRVYASAGGEIGLSQGATCVIPSWPRIENDCLIMAHELGHLVNARHVPGKQWIMGWAAHPFHLPAADPIARVVATYRFHPRNVRVMRAMQQARFTPQGLRLPTSCQRMLELVDRCWKL
jgi:hypothetical protein